MEKCPDCGSPNRDLTGSAEKERDESFKLSPLIDPNPKATKGDVEFAKSLPPISPDTEVIEGQ